MFRRLLAIGLLALVSGLSWAAPTSDEYYKAGLKLYVDQRLSDSESYFRAAVQLDPKNWKAYLGLGNTAMKAGKKDLAIAAYEHSLYYNPDQPVIRTFLDGLKHGGTFNYVWDPGVDPYPLQTGPANPLPKPLLATRQYLSLRMGVRESFLPCFNSRSFDYILENTASGTETYEQLHFGLSRSFSLALGLEQWSYSINNNSYYYARDYKANPFTIGLFFHTTSPKVQFNCGCNVVIGKFSGTLVDKFNKTHHVSSYSSWDGYYYYEDTITCLSNNSFKAIDIPSYLSINLISHVTLQMEAGFRVGFPERFTLLDQYNDMNSYDSNTQSGAYTEKVYLSSIALHGGVGLQIGF